jgi:hypothetical protein
MKVASDVSNARFSVYYRRTAACKDKWQTLFADYKKISGYKAPTRSREDSFHIASKRHKELTLPPNFCSGHYREMEKFLNQRPCLNPPRQHDSFIDEDDTVHSTEEFAKFCAAQNLTTEMLSEEDGFADPILQHGGLARNTGTVLASYVAYPMHFVS